MNLFSKKRLSNGVYLFCALLLFQKTNAVESSQDVYPAPPQPPRDAFALQWQAPKPTLTGKAITPQLAKFNLAGTFKGFSANATLKDVDSASLVQVPLMAPSAAKEKIIPDAVLKTFLEDHQKHGGVLNSKCISKVQTFLAKNPQSPFRFTILMELADAQWRHGWFMESIESYRKAWDLGKQAKDPQGAALGQVALSHLLTAYSATGAKESLKTLLSEVKDLDLSAGAKECYRKSESLIWYLEHQAEQNIFCGFTALNTICTPYGIRPAFPDVHNETEKAEFVERGLSVFELIAHSHECGGKSLAVKRPRSAEIPVPSVMHWAFNHYSAITKQENGLYYIEDSHLKFSGWVEKSVIDTQSTGVFILPTPDVSYVGCSKMNTSEMKTYYGRHCTHGRDDEGPVDKTGCGGNSGMATYSFSLLNPGLALGDTPIRLETPYGPPVVFEISYLQRRNGTLATIPLNSGGNLGSTWSHNFMEWIELKGTGSINSQVNLVSGDGSYYSYRTPMGSVSGSTFTYANRYEDRSALDWNGTEFILRNKNGSFKRYGLSQTSGSTRYLLTHIVDAHGSTVTLTYDATRRLIKVTGATGKFLQLNYTPTNGDGVVTDTLKIRSVTDSDGRTAQFRYDAQGRLTKSIDTLNITSQFSYGANDFIDSLTTPYGTTRFQFENLPGINSEPGRRIKATDPYGFTECAESNDLTNLSEADDDMKLLQSGNITASVSVPVAGSNVTFMPKNDYLFYRNTWYWDKNAWYHAPGNYAEATNYNWLAVDNNIVGVAASMKKAHEGRVWFNYKNQLSAHAPGTLTSSSKTLRLVETSAGNQWAMQQTAFYGPWSKPTRSIDPLGRESIYEYSGNDLNTAAVKTGVNSTDFTILGTASNYLNRLPKTITDVSGKIQYLTYNSVGQITQILTQKGVKSETTKFTYHVADGLKTKGDLLSIQHTDPLNSSAFVTLQSFAYDAFRRIRTSTDEQGYSLTYDYDAMDRVRLVTHPDATTEQYEYENLDLTASKNRKGEWSRTKFTALRQPAYTIDPLGRVTSYEYCLCGQIKKLTDPRGAVTRWNRDNMGRVIEKIFPDLTKTSLSYQPRSGRLSSITRPNDQGSGHVTASFNYTLDGMTAGVDYYDPGTPDSTFTYKDAGGVPDPLRRLLSRTDPIGTTTYSYKPLTTVNGAGQLYEENGPLADDTLRRDYDWQGIENFRQIRSDGGAVLHSESFLTDSLDRLTQSTNELGSFTAGYVAGNLSANLNTWSRPNGLNSQFDWYPASAGSNALGLQQIHHSQGGATVSKFGHTYDHAGQIQKWTRQLDPSAANQKNWDLAYSRAGELSEVVEKNASAVETRRASWSYDPSGNWYATGDSTATTHRSHDSMNRLSQIGGAGKTIVEGTLNEPATVKVSGQPAQVSSLPGTSTFKFQKEIPVTQGTNNFQITATDARGNARSQNYSVQVGTAQKTYEYDSNGNLLRERDPVGAIIRAFEWDAADRLKAVTSGGQRIEWTYNGLGQRVLQTLNGVPAKRFLWDGIGLLLEKSPTGVVTKRFYADGEQRVGGTDAGNYYYTRDHLGSIREVVNQTGSVVARYDYDAFGKRSTLTQNPSYLNGCTFGYTGHVTLPSPTAGQSELVLTHYRAYDPQLGRWLSPDPIGEAGGLNLYGYVGGDPVNQWDPLGLWTFQIGVVIGGRFFGDANAGVGFVIDSSGGIGFYRSFQLGIGFGAGVSGGLSVGMSNGDCIEDMAGPFNNFGAEVGVGIDGSAEGFWGEGSHGQPVVGGGFTAGPGLGGGASVGRSWTGVNRYF